MRYKVDQSVRLIYAERTATVMGLKPPSTYVVYTEDGYIWDVGEDEIGPLNGSADDPARSGPSGIATPDGALPQRRSAPQDAAAVTVVQEPPRYSQRPVADSRRPVSRGPRGAGWALGFMPLATLVAEYAISFALAKPLRATGLHVGAAISPLSGVAAGGAFALVGIAFSVGGLMIVYNATQDIGLTVGYFIVRWVEGYLLTFILTAAVLGSLGLLPSAQAVAGASTAIAPQAVSLPFVRNDEGVELRFNGHQISIDWTRQTPPFITVGIKRYPLAGSLVQLICFDGGEGLRRTATLQSGSDSVAWPLSQIPAATTQCEGYVTRIPHLGDDEPPMSWSI